MNETLKTILVFVLGAVFGGVSAMVVRRWRDNANQSRVGTDTNIIKQVTDGIGSAEREAEQIVGGVSESSGLAGSLAERIGVSADQSDRLACGIADAERAALEIANTSRALADIIGGIENRQ